MKRIPCSSSSSRYSSLCTIPSHIFATGVFKYLKWKEIGRLDTACTNYELRSKYLSDVYKSLRVKSVFFSDEKEENEHKSVLHWPVVSHEGTSVQSGAELLTSDDYFANIDQKFYRFMKCEIIIWAIDRSICLDSDGIHLSMYKFNPHTRSMLLQIFISAKSNKNRLKIKSLWIAETFDVENFLMDHMEALKYVRELNIPLRTFELWDFISSLPSLDTLYIDEKSDNLNYGISTLLISNIRTKLKFLYLGSTEAGYSYRFFSNLGKFKNLESLCVHNVNSVDIFGKLDDIFLPILPSILHSLKRLILFRCPTISFTEVALNLAKFVNSSASKLQLQYFQFEDMEVEEVHILIDEDRVDNLQMLEVTRESILQPLLQGCVVKYSVYSPVNDALR